jgi:hypothetical protein
VDIENQGRCEFFTVTSQSGAKTAFLIIQDLNN